MIDKKLVKVCKERGWDVNEDDDVGTVVLDLTSLSGEGFSFAVDTDDFVENIRKYCEEFNIDDYVIMWIDAKKSGVPGVPSIRELLEDAQYIDYMLHDLYNSLVYAQSAPKKFCVTYYEHSVLFVDVEANSREEAEEKWSRMLSNGEVRFDKMEVFETETRIEEEVDEE